MSNALQHDDLSFLDRAFPELHLCGPERYRKAGWLKCNFDKPVWTCGFEGENEFEIDWRVPVGKAGGILTDPIHRPLWTALRCWLVLSTHPDSTGGRLLNVDTERRRFNLCRDWIDYFLIHADSLGLPEHGLNAIVRDDIYGALVSIGSSATKAVGIYNWPTRVEEYLRECASAISAPMLEQILGEFPFIAVGLQDRSDSLTKLSKVEVVKARAWLWSKGFYRRGTKSSSFRWIVSSRALAALVYNRTFIGNLTCRSLPELGLIECETTLREYPFAPVRTSDDARMSRERLNEYCQSLATLGLLSAVGVAVPTDAIRTLNDPSLMQSLDLKRNQRFCTLPAHVVFSALRNAIEFGIKYGPDLVSSYLSVAKAASLSGLTIAAYASENSIENLVTESIKRLGVRDWKIRCSGPSSGAAEPLNNAEYFSQLRANIGLWELIRVYYGCVQVALGTLMARRVRELTGLVAGQCLDKSGTYLVFDVGKSGVANQRQTEGKPIPSVAAGFVRELERLQRGLVDLGLIKVQTHLFCHPCGAGDGTLSQNYNMYFSRNNDYFCDYFQMVCDSEGRRYYIRQHQLRRFFAMLFFWSNSFGGLETLREFMGHANAEHIYRYITESTPGTLLRSVQAEWAGEAVKRQWAAAGDLSELVEQHFHTRNVRLLKDDELAEYIEELMLDGRVTIEPEFIDSGKQYRVLIKVTAKEFV